MKRSEDIQEEEMANDMNMVNNRTESLHHIHALGPGIQKGMVRSRMAQSSEYIGRGCLDLAVLSFEP